MSEKKASIFTRFARTAAKITGKPATFLFAFVAVILWAISGPLFDFSDTWQLVINTSTTIITFLMVFLIQNSQNSDTQAIHIKLDEIILCLDSARNKMLDMEEMDDAELDKVKESFQKEARRARDE